MSCVVPGALATPAVTRYSTTVITAATAVTAELQQTMCVQALHQLQHVTAVFGSITAAVTLHKG